MFLQNDMECGGTFWDCPNLCNGARPKKRKKIKVKAKALASPPQAATSIPILAGKPVVEAAPPSEKQWDVGKITSDAIRNGAVCPTIITFADGTKRACGMRAETESSIPSQRRYCWIHGGPDAGKMPKEKSRFALGFVIALLCFLLSWLISRITP
jgi:hypothetical protein